MADPVAGLAEMRRVTRPGGVVAACVWDHAGGRGPLSPFWQAAHELDPAVTGESELPGSRQADLTRLFEAAGLSDVEETALTVRVEHPTFEEWWEPFTLGVGPAGAYVAKLEPGPAGSAARAVPCDAARGAVRARVAGVDGPRPRFESTPRGVDEDVAVGSRGLTGIAAAHVDLREPGTLEQQQ